MPRPKLYSTLAQRREANRLKNKRFYDRNRTKILQTKKSKREDEQRALVQEGTRQRQKRRKENLAAVDSTQSKVELKVHQPASVLLDPLERYLEDRLEHLKDEYRKQVKPGQRAYIKRLAHEAVEWKSATRSPIKKRITEDSPLIVAKRQIDYGLSEYKLLERDYFDLIRDKQGKVWDDKRRRFTLYKEVVSELVDVLTNMQEELDILGWAAEFEDLIVYNRY
ncbi:hypothetical protein V5O48_015662 [Marasmius crinis-equi]|uniref:Uncharacterized protein n=1 Tax=Marasmius crinis-equi TaxID=585013 RepID=A0ABR3ETW3_9AGAR